MHRACCRQNGRIRTNKDLTVLAKNIFASGDCGVVSNNYREPSGVWAIKASKILAENLSRAIKEQRSLIGAQKYAFKMQWI